MKRWLVLLLAGIWVAFGASAQQVAVKYLTDVAKPTEESKRCHVVPHSTKPGTDKIRMGGMDWDGGFVVSYSVGPYDPGRAVFKLGGKYEK